MKSGSILCPPAKFYLKLRDTNSAVMTGQVRAVLVTVSSALLVWVIIAQHLGPGTFSFNIPILRVINLRGNSLKDVDKDAFS
ncbi:hypothetical protein Hamer_G011038, partial [Homarus americanus]